MILYIEKQAKDYKQTNHIISKFKNADIVWIDNYKNIFDKKMWDFSVEKSIIVAKLTSAVITDAPKNYGHNNETSYFFKTSLNCVYDCSYCFLKGAFKNDMQVYFVNYEEIKQEIVEKIRWISSSWKGEVPQRGDGGDYELKIKSDYNNALWFYSSDYSDILWMDYLSGFMQEFVPFFEEQAGTMMEVRTKSANIKPILDLWFVPKNTEFSFSLNPQELIKKYESWTSSLDERIESINVLLRKWYKVWLRFLPLLPVKNYRETYREFVQEVAEKIDMSKISSSFASGLLYTKKDYNVMLKKYPKLDVLYRLQEEKNNPDWFIRENREIRDYFYNLFRELDEKCFICLDEPSSNLSQGERNNKN